MRRLVVLLSLFVVASVIVPIADAAKVVRKSPKLVDFKGRPLAIMFFSPL